MNQTLLHDREFFNLCLFVIQNTSVNCVLEKEFKFKKTWPLVGQELSQQVCVIKSLTFINPNSFTNCIETIGIIDKINDYLMENPLLGTHLSEQEEYLAQISVNLAPKYLKALVSYLAGIELDEFESTICSIDEQKKIESFIPIKNKQEPGGVGSGVTKI